MSIWRRDNDEITREEANHMRECADCRGNGRISTPSKNEVHRFKTCAICHGKGYITAPSTAPHEGGPK